jgi:O-methyltransferase involved in polyketide biosynthesis
MPSQLSLRRGPEAVSPTAHYTGHVWGRNDLSHPALRTRQGRLFFAALQPAMRLNRAVGGATLEGMLLARHRAIDGLLEAAIEERGVSQVIEVACGMSPRGWRFGARYGDRLTYVEADLPAMARRKRRALERIGSLSDAHRIVELDALAEDGPTSLGAVAAGLDRDRGLAIVTEGLLGYLPPAQVAAAWQRFAALLGEFPSGRYLSDLHVASESGGARVRAFRLFLSSFVRGRVHLHFADAAEAEAALLGAGFSTASVRPAGARVAADDGGARVQVLEAAVGPAS